MAETSDNSNKIACRSRNAVTFINKTLYDSLDTTLQKDGTRTPEERSRYIKRFKEVFEKVSQQNILVNGETGVEHEEANTTPEYEPVDRQKAAHISEELQPRLDDCVVRVAKQRKRLPRVCISAVTDFSNHQAAYMSKVKPRAQDMDMESLISDSKDVMSFIDCQRLHHPSADLCRVTKMASKDRQRAGHLNKAVEIEVANRDSQTAKVLYGHTPLVDNGCHHVCDLCRGKRRLDSRAFDDNPTSAKMPRLSGMLARDFTTVQPLSI
ncbi:uncharacterized protein LOC143295770 [Babylonia areolata]|uniref:uncharacterized protein LOC143295770 n=1 Tax=Babylonia areolata TaxID=304850 RepID=UPI003FD4ACCC